MIHDPLTAFKKLILPAFPIPPSVNECYATVNGMRLLTAKARSYKQIVAEILNTSGMTTQCRDFIYEHITVDLSLYVYRPNWFTQGGQPRKEAEIVNPRRRGIKLDRPNPTQRPNRNAGDADNRTKILQDAIFKTVGLDDCCVFYTGVRKVPSSYTGEEKVIVVFRQTPDEIDEL